MSASPKLSPEQRAWLKSFAVFPETLVLERPSGNRTVFRILDRDERGRVTGVHQRMGMKGFVLHVEDPDTHAEYAAKLCVPEDYDAVRSEQAETLLAAQLRPASTLFAIPLTCGRVARFPEMPGTQSSFVCFVSEWIVGKTIEQHCQTEELSIEFIASVAKGVARAVTFLGRKGLKHDDLHWGNVMMRPPADDLVMTEAERNAFSLCLIDMGSLKPIDQTTLKSKDDYLGMVDVLRRIYNVAWQQREAVTQTPTFFEKFQTLLYGLLDEDPSRHFPTPDLLMDAISEMENAGLMDKAGAQVHKFRPFEGISAEHLADDETLLALFNDSLPWFPFVMEPKPVVLVGPRGCGKSMLFRYLAAATQAKSSKVVAGGAKPTGFGVYISCSIHLQNSLVWIAREPGRAAKLASGISAFFQVVVVRELVRTIAAVWEDEIQRDRFDLRANQLDKWIQWINQQFAEPIESPRLLDEHRLAHFADDLDTVRVRIQKDMLHFRQNSVRLGDDFVGTATAKLAQLLPAFAKERVIFLLDDYTDSRIKPEIQAVLNRIIFERRGSHYFKISCERMGVEFKDIDGIRIDASREYDEIDAATHAVDDCSITDAEDFLRTLIDKRLERAEWKGRCETLIGTSAPYEDDGAFATYLRDSGSTQGRKVHYYGMRHLARLWSGDIATILQIVKAMCIEGAVNENSCAPITHFTQHKAIISISKAYRSRVKDLHPHGLQLSRILEAYGSMARNVLLTGRLDSHGKPKRLYQLEMTRFSKEPFLAELGSANPEARDIAVELLRRSVFNPLRESRGKEPGANSTIRWELRNIFRPAFGLSLAKSDSYLDIKQLEDFVSLLVEPSTYCEASTQRYAQKGDRFSGELFSEADPT